MNPGCRLKEMLGSTCNVDPRGCMDCKATAGPVPESFRKANEIRCDGMVAEANRRGPFGTQGAPKSR